MTVYHLNPQSRESIRVLGGMTGSSKLIGSGGVDSGGQFLFTIGCIQCSQPSRADRRALASNSPVRPGHSVRYGAGRGGFSLAVPRPYTGPEATHSLDGAPFFATNFYWGPVWVMGGVGPEWGQGQGMLENTPRPGPLSGAGRGMWPGARVFGGPGGPVTNSTRAG